MFSRKVSNMRKHTMRSIEFSFSRFRVSSAALVLLTFISAPLAADSEVEAILKCKSMQDSAARLACYDALDSPSSPQQSAPAERAIPVVPDVPVEAPPATPKPAAVVPAASPQPDESAPEILSDKVGRETLGPKKGEEVLVRGRIVRCREDLTSKYVFYFENGQVWRQKDNSRIRWDECDFEVTISKDFFGYKMVRDGEKKKVRIAREK
jgi:hypothetical protein